MLIHRAIKTLISKAGWHAYNTYRKGVHYHFKFSQAAALLDAPRETIEAFQAKRLEKLLRHAYQTTSYYRELFKTETPDLSQIPPLEKQRYPRTIGRDSAPQPSQRSNGLRTLLVALQAHRLVFYQDRNYWNQRNLSVYYFDRWAGWNFGATPIGDLGSSGRFGRQWTLETSAQQLLAESVLAQRISPYRQSDAGGV